MRLKTSIGIFIAIVLLSSIMTINGSSFAQINSDGKIDHREKIDEPLREKVDKMTPMGEEGYHRVIIFVKKIKITDAGGYKFDASKNKDNLEAALLENHEARNVYKAKVLSFVSADVPIRQIEKIAIYDYVDQIGDEEIESTPLSMFKSDHDSLSNPKHKVLPIEPNLDVAKQATNLPAVGPTGSGVIVALLDRGIRQDHPDLPVGQTIIIQATCTPLPCHTITSAEAGDTINHGTHAAGIIAGQGNVDINLKGIAPNAKLINMKETTQFPEALDFALSQGARVVSINQATGGCVGPGDQYNSIIRATDEAVEMGAVIATGIGNNGGSNAVNDLACGYNVLAVGAFNDMNTATTTDDAVWPNSFKGPAFDNRLKPELVAPGVNINSTDAVVNYANVNGTSFAGPFVAATSALILESHPTFSPEQVRAALLVGARWNATIPMSASTYEQTSSTSELNSKGFGFLNIGNSINLANSGKVIKDAIQAGQTKEYTFSANAGEQVKVVLTWNRHLIGNITSNTPANLSNLNFEVINLFNGSQVIASNSANQTNEFVVFNANATSYKIVVSAPSVDPSVGTQVFALASTHMIESANFAVKKGTFTKAIPVPQFARPDSDIDSTQFQDDPVTCPNSNSNGILWDDIDESTPSETDCVHSIIGLSNTSFEVGLSNVTDPNTSTGHIIRFRCFAGGTGAAEKASAILLEGTIQRAQTPTITCPRSFPPAQLSYTLTNAEADSITNYNNLSIRIVTTHGTSDRVEISWIEFEVPSAPASQSITGLGFKPKALMLFTTGQTVEGFNDGYNFAIGFSDGINSRSIGVASDDNAASSNVGRAFGAKLLKLVNSGTPTIAAEADLTSFDANGFTIKWTTNDSTASIIQYIALGGPDLTNANVSSFAANTVTGFQSVTGLGFKPDFVMFMHAASTLETSTATHGYMSYGFATSSAKRDAIAVTSEDGRATMDTWGTQKTDRAIVMLDERTGVIDAEADLNSMDPDGFTIIWMGNNPPDAADRVYFLALKGGQYDVGSFAKATSAAPVTQTITGLGFQPKGLILSSFNNIASTAVQSNNRLSLGASDGINEGMIWAGDQDAAANSITARSTVTTKVIRLATEAATGSSSTINAEADLQSLDTNGFTLNWTTNDSVAKQILYVAFGIVVNATTINVSNTAGSSRGPEIAASGGNVYVVWTEGSEVFLARSINSGTSFGTAINLSNNGGFSSDPHVVASGSNVYVVWHDDTPSPNVFEVFFRRSTDWGNTFDPTINVSNDGGNSQSPLVAVEGNNVYVVWRDITANDIFFARSTDNGVTFSASTNLSSSAGSSDLHDVAALGSNVYVVWRDFSPGKSDIFFRRSADNGANFSGVVNLSSNAEDSFSAQVVASGSNVYVTWVDNTPDPLRGEIFFRRSVDSGASFGTTINLSNTFGTSRSPQISTDGSNVYVVWDDFTTGDVDIYFKRSTDNGATFGSLINISNNPAHSIEPQVASFGNNVYVLWRDNPTGNFDVFLSKSTDNGASFGSAINISNNPWLSAFSLSLTTRNIAVSVNNVYIAWEDALPNNNFEISFKATTA